MRIKEITSTHGNDFSARMECEHCGTESKLTSGYHDDYYHNKVIPAMTCVRCLKNRAGEIPTEANVSGYNPVS